MSRKALLIWAVTATVIAAVAIAAIVVMAVMWPKHTGEQTVGQPAGKQTEAPDLLEGKWNVVKGGYLTGPLQYGVNPYNTKSHSEEDAGWFYAIEFEDGLITAMHYKVEKSAGVAVYNDVHPDYAYELRGDGKLFVSQNSYIGSSGELYDCVLNGDRLVISVDGLRVEFERDD